MRRCLCIVTIGVFLWVWTMPAIEAAEEFAPEEMVIQKVIPRNGFSLGYGFDAIWMMSEGRLIRVNAADNSAVEIELPAADDSGSLPEIDRYRGIAVGEGGVWVPDVANSTIYKVDPQFLKVILTIPTDMFGSQRSIGIGEGSVWVITFEDKNRTLTRYNASSGTLEARVVLPRPGNGVLVDYGSVWVTAATKGELYRIDPKTNQVADVIALPAQSHLLASGYGSIWIPFDTVDILQRIDGRTGEVQATIQTNPLDMETDGDIAEGGGYIWLISRRSGLARIDPTTNSVKGLFRPTSGSVMGRRVRYGAGSLWISGGSIFRISPPS